MAERAAAPGPAAIAHSFADVNGVRLHYAHAGEGRLILFLHGFPEFWYAWRNQLAEFGRDSFAVAPDMRGYNLSSKPDNVEAYDMTHLVGDIVALIGKLGAKSCCLVGHDWGGVVAWVVAVARPEIIEKLVIINAPHPAIFQRELHENPAQQQASQYMLMFRSPEAEEVLSADNCAVLQQIVLDEGIRQGHLNEADRLAYLEAWTQPGALTGGLNYYRASKIGPVPAGRKEPIHGLEGQASLQVNVPTMVIWGESDTALLTGNLNGLEHYVPNLFVKRVPDATHWIVHEKSELVNSLIRDFISH
jgi:pimeloyl-ACP methyl ester carboxylesterase